MDKTHKIQNKMKNVKKILSVIICVVVLVSAFAITAFAGQDYGIDIENNAEGLAKMKDILENPSSYAGYTVYIIEDIDLSDLAEIYKEDISLPSIRFENIDGAVIKGLDIAPFKIKVSMYEGEYRTMQLLNPVKADNGWYKNEDGGYLYMKNSRAAKGWFQDKTNKAWYYLKPTNYGIASVGWEKIDGEWYFFDSQCVMLTGW